MNNILDFLQKLLILKHGTLAKARYSVSNSEVSARCPFCRDSKLNTRKRRFYYSLKTNVFFCHNCQVQGTFAKLLQDFKNVPNINYDKLEKEIDLQKVNDFINGSTIIQNQKIIAAEWELEFPEGSRLDTIFENKIYKKLPPEDKVALLKVCKYLQSRGISKEWYHYFYFVFPGEKLDNYILTLFEYLGNWVWSGRKIDDNRPGPKYLHVAGFPFHSALGFANEVSATKGKNIYIVESWFSALLLNQANLNSVCVFGLMNMKANHPPLDVFRKKYKLVWVPDQDSSFKDFCKINKDLEIKIITIPTKDAADYAVAEGVDFRKKFLSLPVKKLNTQLILNNLKTLR